ncbi:hypothetical protein CYY_007380 [Polysphondylium violaceum]|uniref:Uncharacterized protein n=1 Tax=Polysphondylium violaceum TaxID=133409 RepID=A0A8J4PNQ6_9MYCE|nr:hypothetical protein CYY_007380 [Polysphondylium violaceum]
MIQGLEELIEEILVRIPIDLVNFLQKLNAHLTLPQILEWIKTTIEELTLEGLLEFTVFDLFKRKDKVRERADQIFLEHLQYYTDPKVLEALGWEKPTLDQDRLEMISDAQVKEWYTKYASLWVVLLTDYELPGKVNSNLIKADMQQMAASRIYTSQMTKIYNYAYLEAIPKMAFYVHTAAVWTPLLTDYYMSKDYLEFWIDSVMLQIQNDQNLQFYKDLSASYTSGVNFVDTLQKNTNTLDSICSDIRAKLDILDPTCRSSNKVIGYLQQVSMVVHLLEGGLNEKFEENLEQNITTLFNNYIAIKNPDDTQDDIIQFIKDLLAISGGQLTGAITIAADIIKASNKTNNKLLATAGYQPKGIAKYYVFEAEVVEESVKAHPLYYKLLRITNFSEMFCGIWRGCQAMVLLLTVVNYDTNQPIMTQAQFVGDSVALLADFVTAYGDYNDKYITSKFSSFGKLIGTTFSKFTPARLGNFFSNNLIKIFTTTAADFISYRVTPILLLVACYNNILDYKTSTEEKNWGSLVCDLGALGCNLASAGILLLGVPYTTLAVLIIGTVTIGLILIKNVSFPAKTPIEKYYASTLFPLKYKQL